MNRQDFDAWDARIKDRADALWNEAGRPEGGRDRYLDAARELLAIEEVALPTLDPREAAEPVIEEASIQGNLGEFPTLTDQGEEQTYPHVQDDDGPRLSDGDASADGGVLPLDEEPKAAPRIWMTKPTANCFPVTKTKTAPRRDRVSGLRPPFQPPDPKCGKEKARQRLREARIRNRFCRRRRRGTTNRTIPDSPKTTIAAAVMSASQVPKVRVSQPCSCRRLKMPSQ